MGTAIGGTYRDKTSSRLQLINHRLTLQSEFGIIRAVEASAAAQEDSAMKLVRRQFLKFAAGAAALSVASLGASAQTYPARPITMVVPFPAGGILDSVGRIVTESMRVSLGQPIIIENVAGANGSIGVGRVARAASDGYTIGIGFGDTHVINAAIYTLPYDVQTDFAPIALVARSRGSLILAKKAMPPDDLKGLIDWLKSNPDQASQGHPGVGSTPHLIGIQFQKVTGTRYLLVPYRGATPAMQDLVAGQIDLIFTPASIAMPQVRAGTVKAYAVMDKGRLASAPDIPTADEAGLPGFYASQWYGFFAPKGTPKTVIARLNAAVVDALAEPAVRQRLADIEIEVPSREEQTPETLRALQKADIEKWWPIIREAGIKAQ
jgi:tripartite-type tricarboxylate transporter receptor subunit TctC